MDTFKIVDPDVKPNDHLLPSQAEFDSNEAYFKWIEESITRDKQIKELENNGKPFTYKNSHIFKLITKLFNIRAITDDNGNRSFFVKNELHPLGIWDSLDVEQLVGLISDYIEIPDINKTINDVRTRFKTVHLEKNNIKPLNLAPSYIVLAPNGVMHLKKMAFANDINYFGEYDFINFLTFRILTKDQVNPLMYQIVKRIHNDWGKQDPDSIHYLKQLEFAALEGYGRKIYNVLKGDGGNGKSTFLYILEHLANTNYTARLDLQDVMNDNSLYHIDNSTKLVVGHDLATNAKFSSGALSRIKEFVMGEAFLINVKYQPSRMCQTNGLKIQNTNTDISFFENSVAIKRRLRMFEWSNENFSALNDKEFDLDKLVGLDGPANVDFYESIISHMFEGMTYFEEFIKLEKSEAYTEKMINEADSVFNYLNWLQEQELFLFGKMPINTIYQMYCMWLKDENQGASPVQRRKFIERLRAHESVFGYKVSSNRKRLNTFSLLDFNFDFINKGWFHDKLVQKTNELSNYIEMVEEPISHKDVKKFKKHLEQTPNLHNITSKELIILEYLISIGDLNAVNASA